MKEGRDFSIIFHINSHYNDLKDDVVTLDSFKAFVESKEKDHHLGSLNYYRTIFFLILYE